MSDPATRAEQIAEIDAAEAYALLGNDPKAVLVDVRTQAEWSFVGVPDLSALGKEPIFLEWQTFPQMNVLPDFTRQLGAKLAQRGIASDAPLLFICRSGARSLAAARAASSAGHGNCLNVSGGFEGPSDSSRHRGRLDGWKAKDLPWIQS